MELLYIFPGIRICSTGSRYGSLALVSRLMIGLTLMLTSKGVAAVPRASLVILIATADTFDFPLMAHYGNLWY